METDRRQQISGLYHAALERRQGDRAAFLREACAGDEALQHEVESLLAHEDAADAFLNAPAVEVAPQFGPPTASPSFTGRRLGPYHQSGGMGKGRAARGIADCRLLIAG